MKLASAVAGLDCSPQFARRLIYVANRWARHGGPVDLDRITTASLDAYRRVATLSPRTIESDISDLLYIAKRHGIQIDRGKPLRRPPASPRVPTPDQLGLVYSAADAASWPHHKWICAPDWWRAFLVVASWTGLRRGDLIRLSPLDVQSDRIAVVASKTRHLHEIPLTATVRRHLRLLRGDRGTLLGLPSQSTRAWYDQWQRLCQAAGVRPMTCKTIRQYAITNWSSTNAEAGRIIHGFGLGVMSHYIDRFSVLAATAPLVRMPDAFLTDHERDAAERARDELMGLYGRASKQKQRLILEVARSVV